MTTFVTAATVHIIANEPPNAYQRNGFNTVVASLVKYKLTDTVLHTTLRDTITKHVEI